MANLFKELNMVTIREFKKLLDNVISTNTQAQATPTIRLIFLTSKHNLMVKSFDELIGLPPDTELPDRATKHLEILMEIVQ